MATLSRGTSQLVHSFPHFALEWPAADGDSESIPARSKLSSIAAEGAVQGDAGRADD